MTDVILTDLPESVQEAVLARWYKKAGEPVRAGEKLADLETDKIVLDLNAPSAGVLVEILKPEGATLKRGDAAARIDPAGAAAGPAAEPARAPTPAAAPPPPAERPKAQAAPPPPPPAPPPPAAAPAYAAPPVAVPEDLPPSVRKLLLEHRLDPAKIPGTGRDGRLTKADVLRHLESSPHLQTRFGEAAPQVELKAESAPAAPAAPDRPEQRVRMTRLRARIAERLKQAQNSAALLTTFNEVNMEAVMQLRARYKDAFEREHGIKLGFMSFFVKAAVESLIKFPVINASVEGEDVVYHGYYDIGVAVSSPRGLVVPVLRDADRMSLSELESRIADFAQRAEAGKLQLEDLQGGTFTLSNGGVFGSLLSTPIVSPPQSAILGMHRIQKRPVAENDQVVIRPMMYLALTYDHRIIDGREAVQFLVAMKEAIEDPSRLLLQI